MAATPRVPSADPARQAALDAQAAELARIEALTDQALQLELIDAVIMHLGTPPALERYSDEVHRRAAAAAPAPAVTKS